MTVYNLNLGIGWASSGVEYAQAYRAKIFRAIGVPSKFVFMDMIQTENIEHFTSNLGFQDEEIIWLYQFFTDIKIAPTSYTLEQLKTSFDASFVREERNEHYVRYFFEGDLYITAYLKKGSSHLVNRAEFVSRGKLIRKDFYSYTRLYTEYYTPRDNKAYLYQRRFFNEDGSLAYEEILDGDTSIFRFQEEIFYSKAEFIGHFIRSLNLTEKDMLLLDRSTGIGQSVLENKGSSKLGVVIHAEHFSENMTTNDTILWNNYYEYQFQNANLFDFFIASTDVQKDLLIQQFEKYGQDYSKVYAIPVGSVDELKQSRTNRKKNSLVTASRLAGEKHIDWLVQAVIEVRKTISDVTFDIYGEGGKRQELEKLIDEHNAKDYIRLMGHKDLSEIYADYQVYLAGSLSEGFGLTLLEAIGSGLPIIGFDVRYGNPTFVEDGKNGYLIARTVEDKVEQFSEKIIQLLSKENLSEWQNASYERAKDFLTIEVEDKWKRLVEEVTHA